MRSKNGLSHVHQGSLHAADAQMAIENARDVYCRRNEGVSIWVVESKYISASDPADSDPFFEPAKDKVYRHPTFYNLPDEVKHM
jgi:ring-1,2-phenylacetyl-CoA epoxidase subunit PaaB